MPKTIEEIIRDFRIRAAIARGYTANQCPECEEYRMIQTGTCETCHACGASLKGC